MRQIKFKAKRLDNGEWVEGLPCKNHRGETCILVLYPPKDGVNWGFIPIIPDTVCQFTGLKGMDGKEIWEHDLVDSFPISEVVYIHGAFMLYQKDEEAYHPLLYIVKNELLEDCRVICSKFDRKDGEV